MNEEKVNLFVYGSLREPGIFKSVSSLGFTTDKSRTSEETLLAEPAMLPYYRKVTPDNVYFYAVPDVSSKIEGFVIHDVPPSAMAEINRYEGKRYDRETVHVNTAKGMVKAQAYLATHESMKKHFGDRFHVNLIHELWLRKRIGEFIKKRTRPGEETADANLERRAERELLATTERDLVISHYRSDAFSDYYLEHELDRPRPSIKPLRDEPAVAPFAKNYLSLVVKQVILNQLDERIQSHYRFELEHMRTSERYFKRSVSLLVALQMINTDDVELIINKALKVMPFQKYDLIDYVKYAVQAADSIFDPRVALSYLEHIRASFHPGLIPLGAEIELSNLGPAAVEPRKSSQKKSDPAYDGFRYFHDFYLDVLSWKLGGYIDDHTGADDRSRRYGFLELAPGRLNIAGELSRPVTADPWLLNQLIREIIVFYNIHPHSLHLSFQLQKYQIGHQKVLPLDFVKCLLALGGGLQKNKSGKLWISRIGYDEITQQSDGREELVFARTSKRRWFLGEDEVADKPPIQTVAYTQQYKFIRLSQEVNYEPLIMCLKGLQMACNPADYLTAEQLEKNKKLSQEYEDLKKWALEPDVIDQKIIGKFLDTISVGLMNERRRRPAHKLHYIDWALNAIDAQLQMFNKQLKESLGGS
jgi:gamma-glutamylcyclotransferase (GGCT)/AIG2-like uncharacterized protein YtfP